MIIVTGGAGFIGSNIVAALIARGDRDVVVVDDLRDGDKFRNIAAQDIADYLDKDDWLARIGEGRAPAPRAVIHQGACSDTTERDGRYMLANNFEYSKRVFGHCAEHRVPLVYASSAAVYGVGTVFREAPECEQPVNVYGYSKLLFDRWVRRRLADANVPVAGLRYFNVYGPREQHKGRMASVAYHHHRQLLQGDTVRLFAGTDGYDDGGQRRDFVHVDDVVRVNLWALDASPPSGVYNVGTGRSQTFNEVANAVIAHHGRGRIEYVPFPDDLRGRYQSYTEADLDALRRAGYEAAFMPVETGVARYLEWLERADRRNTPS